MMKRKDQLPSNQSFAAFFLLLVAILLYIVAFYSNEWFIVEPSHYGIWSVTFCDILTCQSISTIFNDQPGWYFFVQVFNTIALVFLVTSFVMLFRKICKKNVVCSTSSICTSSQIAVCFMTAGMIMFYVSLAQENHMSRPSISWSTKMASISCVMQISTLMILTH